MTYKGLTIAAEEKIYNLIEVEENGAIGNVVVEDDWTERQYEYAVFADDDRDGYSRPLVTGFLEIDEAKAYIDSLAREAGA